MSDEVMPILGARIAGLTGVPFRLLSEDMAENNHGQSLKTLKSRGGMGVGEILANMEGKRWGTYDNTEEVARVVLGIVNRDEVAAFKERLRQKVEERQTKKYESYYGRTHEAEAARQEGYELCNWFLNLIKETH